MATVTAITAFAVGVLLLNLKFKAMTEHLEAKMHK